jgi:hypothetical protein
MSSAWGGLSISQPFVKQAAPGGKPERLPHVFPSCSPTINNF